MAPVLDLPVQRLAAKPDSITIAVSVKLVDYLHWNKVAEPTVTVIMPNAKVRIFSQRLDQ